MQPDRYAGEAGLLAAAAAGDPEAVRSLLDLTGPAVYGFVFARVGGNEDVAEDLVQETFVEAVRSSHTFRGESGLRTWLCAIAGRRLARYYEAERRDAVARAGLTLVGATRPQAGDDQAVAVEQRDEVIRALGRLPAVHRQVLVMKYLDEMPVEHIAEQLGRSKVQVQSLLQRARTALRTEMESGDA